MKSVQEQTPTQGERQADNTYFVDFFIDSSCAINFLDGVVSSKISQPYFGQLRGNSRVRPRRFSGANQVVVAELESLQITGVDFSGVISTRGGGGPGVNVLALRNHRHAVAGFNLLNFIPSKGEFEDGVGDSDPFIKESDFGMDKEQVGECAGKESPHDRAKGAAQISFQEKLKGGYNSHRESDSRPKITGSGAENVSVGQTRFIQGNIISRNSSGSALIKESVEQ
jgi:hypothetical protein